MALHHSIESYSAAPPSPAELLHELLAPRRRHPQRLQVHDLRESSAVQLKVCLCCTGNGRPCHDAPAGRVWEGRGEGRGGGGRGSASERYRGRRCPARAGAEARGTGWEAHRRGGPQRENEAAHDMHSSSCEARGFSAHTRVVRIASAQPSILLRVLRTSDIRLADQRCEVCAVCERRTAGLSFAK